MRPLSQTLQRLFTRHGRPAGDRANVELVHEMMLELEDPQPNPLLLNVATGFPSALLCVLAVGALVGALAGREVGGHSLPGMAPVAAAAPAPAPSPAAAPDSVSALVQPEPRAVTAVLARRQAQLLDWELQALLSTPQPSAAPAVDPSHPR